MNTKRRKLLVGTSGYQYDHWRDVFYPSDLPKKDWFTYYATHFDTVEINNTFYRLPSAETFAEWRGHAPRGFCYALKFSRYGSHLKCLIAPREPIRRFLARAAHLTDHLGPIFVQLPPRCGVNLDRLASFLHAAPRAYRWAIEFRDPLIHLRFINSTELQRELIWIHAREQRPVDRLDHACFFLRSLSTVSLLIPNTRAVSRIPLPLRAMSIIGRLTSGTRPR
jgi:uncharacterized protein YecE (DUF72 family)